MAGKKATIVVGLDPTQVIAGLKAIEVQLTSLVAKFEKPVGTAGSGISKIPKDFDTSIKKLSDSVTKVSGAVVKAVTAFDNAVKSVETRVKSLQNTAKAAAAQAKSAATPSDESTRKRAVTYLDNLYRFQQRINSELAKTNEKERQLGVMLTTREQFMKRFTKDSAKEILGEKAIPIWKGGAYKSYISDLDGEIKRRKELTQIERAQAAEYRKITQAFEEYRVVLRKSTGEEITKKRFLREFTQDSTKLRGVLVLNREAFKNAMASAEGSLKTMDDYARRIDRVAAALARMNAQRAKIGAKPLTEAEFATGFMYTSKRTGMQEIYSGRYMTDMAQMRDIAKAQAAHEREIARARRQAATASKDLLSTTMASLTRLVQWVLIYRVIHELVLAIQRVMRETVQLGVQYYKAQEIQKIGLRGILAENFKVYDSQKKQVSEVQAMSMLTGVATKQWRQLQAASLAVVGTTEDMMQLYEGILPFAAHLGRNLNEIQEMTKAAAVAAGALGISFQDTRSALIALLQGRALVRNKLVGALGFTREEIAELKGTPMLFDAIMDKLSAFQALADESQNTLAALTESLKDYVGMIGAGMFEPFIVAFKNFIKTFGESMLTTEGGLLGPSRELMSFFQFIQTVGIAAVDGLKDALKGWISDNRGNFRTLAIGVHDAVLAFTELVLGIGNAVSHIIVFAARNRELIKAFAWVSLVLVAVQKIWNLGAAYEAAAKSGKFFALILREVGLVKAQTDTQGAATALAAATAEEQKVAAYLGIPPAAGAAATAQKGLNSTTAAGTALAKGLTLAWKGFLAASVIGGVILAIGYLAQKWWAANAALKAYNATQEAFNRRNYNKANVEVEQGFSSGVLGRIGQSGTMLGSAGQMLEGQANALAEVRTIDVPAERAKTLKYEQEIKDLDKLRDELDQKERKIKAAWYKRRAEAMKAGKEFTEAEPTLAAEELQQRSEAVRRKKQINDERLAAAQWLQERTATLNNLTGLRATEEKLRQEIEKIEAARKAPIAKTGQAASYGARDKLTAEQLRAQAEGEASRVAGAGTFGVDTSEAVLNEMKANLKRLQEQYKIVQDANLLIAEIEDAREDKPYLEPKTAITDEDDKKKQQDLAEIKDNFWQKAYDKALEETEYAQELQRRRLEAIGTDEATIGQTMIDMAKERFDKLQGILDAWNAYIIQFYTTDIQEELSKKKPSKEKVKQLQSRLTNDLQTVQALYDALQLQRKKAKDDADVSELDRQRKLSELGAEASQEVDQLLASIFGDKETIVDTRISGFVKTIHDKLRNIFGKDKLEAIFGDKFELGKIDFDKLTQTFPDVAEALQKLKGFSLNAESFIKAEQSAKRLDKSIASVRESQKLLNDSFQAGDITIGQYVANMRELQEAELNLLIQRREATRQQITALKATAAQSPDGQFVDEEKLRFLSNELAAIDAQIKRVTSSQQRLNAVFDQFTAFLDSLAKFAGLFGQIGGEVGEWISIFTSGLSNGLKTVKELSDNFKGLVAVWQLFRKPMAGGGGGGGAPDAGASTTAAIGPAALFSNTLGNVSGFGGWSGMKGLFSPASGAAAGADAAAKTVSGASKFLSALPAIGMAASAAIGIASALFGRSVEKAKERIQKGFESISKAMDSGSLDLGAGLDAMIKERARVVKEYSKSKSGRKALKEILPQIDEQIQAIKDRIKGIQEAFEEELKRMEVGTGPFGDFALQLFDLEKKTREYLATFVEGSVAYDQALDKVVKMFTLTLERTRDALRENIMGFELEAISAMENVFSLMEEQKGLYEQLSDIGKSRQGLQEEALQAEEDHKEALAELDQQRNDLAAKQLDIQERIAAIMQKAREDEQGVLRRGLLEAQLTVAQQKTMEIAKIRMDAQKELRDLADERKQLEEEVDGFAEQKEDLEKEYADKQAAIADRYQELNVSEERIRKQIRLNQIRLDGAKVIAQMEGDVFGLQMDEYKLAERRTQIEIEQAQIQVKRWQETKDLVGTIYNWLEQIGRGDWNLDVPAGFPIVQIQIGYITIDNSIEGTTGTGTGTGTGTNPDPPDRPDRPPGGPVVQPVDDGRYGFPL